MAQKTDSQLAAEAQVILNQTVPMGNTKTLVGQLFQDLVDSKPNNSATTGVDGVQVSSAGSTITLDMANKVSRIFFASPNIAANKSFVFANVGAALTLQCIFTVNALYVMTLPANVSMSDALWNSAAKTWTPQDIGTYRMRGVYNSVTNNWYIEIEGPFS